MKLKILLLISVAITSLRCDKYCLEDIIYDGLENLDFECFDGSSKFYFKGELAEYSICVFDGEYGYEAFFGHGNGFVTTSPSFTLEELENLESNSFISMGFKNEYSLNGFLERIRIKTQPQKFGTSLDSMVRTFLIPGSFPVRGVVHEDSISTEGFEILVNKWHHNPDLHPDTRNITMTSALGVQPSSSHVKIHEVVLKKNGDYEEGHIRLEVSCRMYLRNSGELDGDFVGDFEGEFRLPIRYKP